ncbi:MAG TPA: type II toxin-antitoxin system VapB family antitoxin [Pseudobdellovibrionaceae bacterium]|nr:type II toxin-antitoxin system VapB family antitoxin [Pseudobdellovibrionaceae bacterium]
MRTTLDLNQDLLKKAQGLTHIKEKTALIHEALRALIARAAQVELSQLKGGQPKLKPIARRKSK